MRHRQYPWVEPPDWLQFSRQLENLLRRNTIRSGKVTLDIEVDRRGVVVTNFDFQDGGPQMELAALGVLQSIRRHAIRAMYRIPRLIVLSPNSDRVEPLLEREGFTVYRFPADDSPHEIIGILKNV